MQECSHPVSNYRTNSFWNPEPSAPGEPLCIPAPFAVWTEATVGTDLRLRYSDGDVWVVLVPPGRARG